MRDAPAAFARSMACCISARPTPRRLQAGATTRWSRYTFAPVKVVNTHSVIIPTTWPSFSATKVGASPAVTSASSERSLSRASTSEQSPGSQGRIVMPGTPCTARWSLTASEARISTGTDVRGLRARGSHRHRRLGAGPVQCSRIRCLASRWRRRLTRRHRGVVLHPQRGTWVARLIDPHASFRNTGPVEFTASMSSVGLRCDRDDQTSGQLR